MPALGVFVPAVLPRLGTVELPGEWFSHNSPLIAKEPILLGPLTALVRGGWRIAESHRVVLFPPGGRIAPAGDSIA